MATSTFRGASPPHIPTQDLVSWVFNGARYDRDKPIYVDPADPARSISYNQARDLVGKLATGLRKAGLQSGDVVLVHSLNDIYYPMLFLGIIAAGGVFAGTNPAYMKFELCHHIQISKAKFLISEPGGLPELLAAADSMQFPRERFWVFDAAEKGVPSDMKSWTTLLQHGESSDDWIIFDDLERSKNTAAAMQFSSGTTGLPKAAILTHYNLVAQHTLVYEANPRPYQMIRIIPVPIFHVGAGPVTHTSAIRAGVPTYIMRRFELQKYLEYNLKYQVTECIIVPPIVVALINSPLLDDPKYLSNVKFGFCGAAPLEKSTQARLRSKLPAGVPLTQAFGMTEISSIGFMTQYPEDDDTGSIGKLIPGLEAKLVGDDGSTINAYDTRGELCLRGPTVFKGYFENEKANQESFDSDGWFKTGDVAYCSSATERWHIVDRKKELIKVQGFQVAPPELEAVLLEHPEIADAAVIGVKFPGKENEYPRAYVVVKSEARKPTEDQVKDFVLSRLAKYKSLTGGVRFVDAIPKNASGKILKKTLREEAAAELKSSRSKL